MASQYKFSLLVAAFGLAVWTVFVYGVGEPSLPQSPKVGTAQYYQEKYKLVSDEYIGYDCLNGWLFAYQGNQGWLYVRDENFKPIRCE
jgi:hypothetical protein